MAISKCLVFQEDNVLNVDGCEVGSFPLAPRLKVLDVVAFPGIAIGLVATSALVANA